MVLHSANDNMKFNRSILTVLCLAIVAIFAVSVPAQKKPAPKKFTTAGYFSDIAASKESGDFCCLAVYLTQSSNKTFALVTMAEGTIFDPVLVEATTSGKDKRNIEFTMPDENGNEKYTGTVSAANLTLKLGTTRSVLKRKCANTYSDISLGSGGDLGGTEVYITDSGGSWWALVTTAQGELGEPVLVKADVTGKNYEKIAFTLPDSDRKFTGVIGKTSLTLNESGTKSVLKAKCYQ